MIDYSPSEHPFQYRNDAITYFFSSPEIKYSLWMATFWQLRNQIVASRQMFDEIQSLKVCQLCIGRANLASLFFMRAILQ